MESGKVGELVMLGSWRAGSVGDMVMLGADNVGKLVILGSL